MCHFFETIQLLNGELKNIDEHNFRFNYCRKLHFGSENIINLADQIIIPEEFKNGLVRCRISYSQVIEKIEFFNYTPKIIRNLKIVDCNEISYSFKSEDRSAFQTLLNENKDYDEIIIVKNGFVTDTSFSNLIFYDGKKWITPSTPLLKGVCRATLLKKGLVEEAVVRREDIFKFSRLMLINAMLGFDENRAIDINPELINRRL